MVKWHYYAGNIVRKFYSFAPYFGLIPKANTLGRRAGVSAVMKIRNEPWIEPSLLSIKDFADEIIVVDSSNDDTPEKVRNVMKEHDLNLNYIYRVCDAREAVQIGLAKSACEWILRWDGDFVAYEHINKLKPVLAGLSAAKYYIIEFPMVCLDFDLFHIQKDRPYQTEGWIVKYSPSVGECVDRRGFPKFYEKRYFPTVYAMHLRHVKPSLRLLEREYETPWLQEENKQKYGNSFQEYLKAKVKRDYGIEDLNGLAERKLEKLKEQVAPYDKKVFGDYPKALKKLAKHD